MSGGSSTGGLGSVYETVGVEMGRGSGGASLGADELRVNDVTTFYDADTWYGESASNDVTTFYDTDTWYGDSARNIFYVSATRVNTTYGATGALRVTTWYAGDILYASATIFYRVSATGGGPNTYRIPGTSASFTWQGGVQGRGGPQESQRRVLDSGSGD